MIKNSKNKIFSRFQLNEQQQSELTVQMSHQYDALTNVKRCERTWADYVMFVKAAQLGMITLNVLKPFRSNFNYSLGWFILLLEVGKRECKRISTTAKRMNIKQMRNDEIF